MRRCFYILAILALSGIVTGGCRTTYTDADLAEAERKQDAELVAEEERSEGIGYIGGENREAIYEDEEAVITDSDR